MYKKSLKDIPVENVSAGSNTTKQVLIGSNEAPNFAMRKFTIEPGGGMPLHTNSVEHEQLVLNGSAEIIIGNEKFTANKNDIIYIPAGIPHSYKTIGNDPFEFLCVVPNKEDKVEILKQTI